MIKQAILKRKKGGGKLQYLIVLSVFLSLFLLPSYKAFSQPYAYVVVPDTFTALSGSNAAGRVSNYDITVIDVNTDMVIGHINIDDDDCTNIVPTNANAPELVSTAGNPILWPLDPTFGPPRLPRRFSVDSSLVNAVVDSSGDKLYLICSPILAEYGYLGIELGGGLRSLFLFSEREQGRVFVIDVSNIAADLAAATATNNVITATVLQKIEVGDAPNDLALSPDGNYLYVANGNVPIDFSAGAEDPIVAHLQNVDTEINGVSIQTVLHTDDMNNPARDFTCAADGTGCEPDDTVGFITRINTMDYATETIEISDGGQLVSPSVLAFSPDGNYLFIADNDYHLLRDPGFPYSANYPAFSITSGNTIPDGFEAGEFNSVSIAILDLTGDEPTFIDLDSSEAGTNSLLIEDRHGISDMIVSPDNSKLFVIFEPSVLSFDGTAVDTTNFDYRVGVYDICIPSSPTLLGYYDVGTDPSSMAFTQDGELYISRAMEDAPDYTDVSTQVIGVDITLPFSSTVADDFQTYVITQQDYIAANTGSPFPFTQNRKLAFSPDGSKLFVTVGETRSRELFSNTDPNDPKVVIYDLEADTEIETIDINEWHTNFASTINIAIQGQRTSVEGGCVVTAEICGDGRDNDFDGRIDCEDSDCANDPVCRTTPPPDNVCADREDGASAGAGMVCCNGRAITTPADGMCPSPGDTAEICGDGRDNDFDGRIDCADADCSTHRRCQPEICNNMRDDDADGMRDCADSECANSPLCPPAPDNVCADREDGMSAGAGMVCCNGRATMGTECPETPRRSGGGGGCTLAGSATVGTATVNLLLPMIVFGLAFGLRRVRKRK